MKTRSRRQSRFFSSLVAEVSAAGNVPFSEFFLTRPKNGIHKGPSFIGSGVKYFRMGDLFHHDWVRSLSDELKLIELTPTELERHRLEGGDLLFCRTSVAAQGVGKCSIVLDGGDDMVPASNLIRVRLDPAKASPMFFYYYFASSPGGQALRAMTRGAAVYTITGGDIADVLVPAFNFAHQERIAALLAAYDELIQNNLRRIEILKEMGQLIYRRWFVEFRYPGHEDTPMIASDCGQLPKGWCCGVLSDLLLLQRGFDLPKTRQRDGSFPVIAATGLRGAHEQARAKGPGVVTGRSGSLGTVQYVIDDFWPLNTTLWGKEFRRATPEFAYFVLKSLGLEQFNSGAAVPTLNRNDISGHTVVVPPTDIVRQFSTLVGEMFQLQHMLQRGVETLRTTRDLLLPRLISGDIDVSELDIDTSWLAA